MQRPFQTKKKDEVWNAEGENCHKCVKFSLSSTLPNGHLPTNNQVLEYLFYARSFDRGNLSSLLPSIGFIAIVQAHNFIFCINI